MGSIGEVVSRRNEHYAASVCLSLLLLVGTAAVAQGPPTLGDMVVNWGRGQWASPVYCKIDGKTVRGIRRVILRPAQNPGHGRPALDVQFVDMKVEDATRCFDLLGDDVLNVIGRVQLRFNGTSHPETVTRDFKRALQRDRGFEFDTPVGVLQVTQVGETPSNTQQMNYRGGTASLRTIARASDHERSLADFESPRKLVLTLTPKGGVSLEVPLFLTELR
jgi:hypothetical protein